MFTYEKVFKKVLRDAAIALGSILVALVLIVLINTQIETTIDSVVAKKELNALLSLQSDFATELRGQYLQIQGNAARIRSALLPSSNVLEFVSALESIASKDSVTQSIRFDVPQDSEATIGDPPLPLVQIGFTLTVQGSIFTFIQYLKDIERLPYFMKVGSMTISAPALGGWQNSSTIVLRGILYTQRDQ